MILKIGVCEFTFSRFVAKPELVLAYNRESTVFQSSFAHQTSYWNLKLIIPENILFMIFNFFRNYDIADKIFPIKLF